MIYALVAFLILVQINVISAQSNYKPRVIVMTDGEIDDRNSMVRFLMYTCDMDVRAIIETNSMFQKNGHSKENWYEEMLSAYEEVYPNLAVHDKDYPKPDYLRSISFVGDEDFDHLKGLNLSKTKPGDPVIYTPDNWDDTPGSNRIVEVLLEENPAPVYIQAWGGGNTAARAFYKLKTEYPNDYQRAVSKAVMYNIWYQDGAGNYIERNHPLVTMIFCDAFSGSWDYRSQNDSFDLIKNDVKNHHGPLGALYPQDYVSEGDSPSFLYTISNGLRNYQDPGFGGWGGRFVKHEGLPNVYVDAFEDGDQRKSLARWIDDVNMDFANRMDWCVASSYEDANHPPVIVLDQNEFFVKSGEWVNINAGRSYDPDNDFKHSMENIDRNRARWFFYKEAGSYKGDLYLLYSATKRLSFKAPVVEKPETIHLKIKLTDWSGPIVSSYERVIVTVEP